MIAVLDYGIGNLRSAEKALVHVGADARLVDSPEAATDAAGIVLPGVGAFGACARALRDSGLDEVVRLCVDEGRPFLGICVGLQLLFEGSEEDPEVPGLGILQGSVRAIAASERRPQMQWNLVRQPEGRCSRLLGDAGSQWYYFVHSYTPSPEGAEAVGSVVGTCDYGGEMAVAFERGNMFGTQFHPEKSASAGLRLLARFARICDETTPEA
ncbi:MAG: imidazole glycerol phosphate synthase subunit HisH [Acidimicrobiales bacterium]